MRVTDGRLGSALSAAGGLLLPVRCAGCSLPGGAWCAACRVASRRPPPEVAGGPGERVGAAGPPCWAATTFEGPVGAAVTAHKDGDRRDVRGVLAALLAGSLAQALAQDEALRAALRRGDPVLVVPVPTARSARRRRGDDPLLSLARAAVRAVDLDHLVVTPALRHTRRVRDQSRLGAAARAANLRGALEVRPSARVPVRARACVVLDDVVTTGATLTEAARALRAAGAVHVAAATLAHTPRR